MGPEKRQITRSALGRPGDPSEIVGTALHLASPASSYTTGSLIRVDGGLYWSVSSFVVPVGQR
ncbi:SDR family oxidoreductase [Nocardia jiangxiensis]|uniref:SDR family oxidoreductase n=1 Tax=Nocardia jiangxiensis TaxID=282685 RepID=A0ABW6RUM0_9NOCA